MQKLGPADCCVAPVNRVSEAVTDEQYRFRGVVVKAEHPTEGSIEQVGPVWAGAETLGNPCELPDLARTHTCELLTEAGVNEDLIAELAATGVIA